MSNKIKDENVDYLFSAILSLRNEEECYSFFRDVCTQTELRAMEQRFEVARLLDEGIKYEDIVEKTGASTATISRVKRCLVYGKDGYEAALTNLKKKHRATRSPKVARKAQFEKERAERKRAVRENE